MVLRASALTAGPRRPYHSNNSKLRKWLLMLRVILRMFLQPFLCQFFRIVLYLHVGSALVLGFIIAMECM